MAKKETAGAAPLQAFQNVFNTVPFARHIAVHRCFHHTVPPDIPSRDKAGRPGRPWHVGPRMQTDHLLLFLREAQAVAVVDNRRIVLERGDLLFVTPGIRFEFMRHGRQSFAFSAIRFHIVDTGSGEPAPDSLRPLWLKRRLSDLAHLSHFFRYVHEVYFKRNIPDRDALLSTLAHALIIQCLLDVSATVSSDDPRVARVKSYIQTRLTHPASLARLAEVAGLSTKHLSRLFMEAEGTSPTAYQGMVRCKYALYLMEELGYTVKETAYHLNYPDQYTFSKQFKRLMGVSPSRYRTRNRKTTD